MTRDLKLMELIPVDVAKTILDVWSIGWGGRTSQFARDLKNIADRYSEPAPDDFWCPESRQFSEDGGWGLCQTDEYDKPLRMLKVSDLTRMQPSQEVPRSIPAWAYLRKVEEVDPERNFVLYYY